MWIQDWPNEPGSIVSHIQEEMVGGFSKAEQVSIPRCEEDDEEK